MIRSKKRRGAASAFLCFLPLSILQSFQKIHIFLIIWFYNISHLFLKRGNPMASPKRKDYFLYRVIKGLVRLFICV